ncbi:MAG TPA: hypothetical protein VGO59_17270 [Verrucomicrobiae bacterium]|jgi:hypothetical protein
MKAKNVNGRRQSSCKCGSWLDHWVKICGQPVPDHCAEARCLAKPVLGAHVQKDSAGDMKWYIIPLCVKHSIRSEFLEIAEHTTFVSAHVGDTCCKHHPLGTILPHEWQATIMAIPLKHGPDLSKVPDWIERATARKIRATGEREARTEKAAPLRTMY